MRRFTAKEAARIAKRLHAQVPARELARGMNVELEHGARDRRTDVTHDDPTKTAKIALAHLYERPDYYDRLAEAHLNPRGRSRHNPGMSHYSAKTKAAIREYQRLVAAQRRLPPSEQWRMGEALRHAKAKALLEIEEDKLGLRRSNPSSMRHLSHGFYQISPAEAGRLARGVGKKLPKHGYELRVQLPDGRLAWLTRTPHQGKLVWAVSGISGAARSNPITEADEAATSRRTALSNYIRIHSLYLRGEETSGVDSMYWEAAQRAGVPLKTLDKVDRRLGPRRRSNPSYALENPPHYSRRGRVVTFDNGHRYVINEATVRQAAQYLAGPVKRAEHAGRRPPTGPHGLTPGAAAVLIHFGRKLLKKRPARKAAPKRRAPARRTPARPRRASTPRPAPRSVPTPRRAPVDFWDREAEIYGG